MDYKDVLAAQRKGMAQLKSRTQVDPNSIADIADEGLCHIIEHFRVHEPPRFQRDFCFVMHSAYLGVDKQNPDSETHATGIYTVGSLDNMAHQLADMMMIDNEIAHMIFHAVHAYGVKASLKAGKGKPNKGGGKQ